MYGVCRLHSLHTLNLAHNGILTIEGLKELIHLKHLCLAGNNIKTIEHLSTNVNLEYLDLSENNITHITDLSFLKNLKVFAVCIYITSALTIYAFRSFYYTVTRSVIYVSVNGFYQ